MPKWALPIVFLIFTESLADIFAKMWALKGGILFVVLSFGVYILANAFWLFALKDGAGLWRGSLIFSIGSAVIAILIGLLMFNEAISRLQILGIIFGIIALTLIFWE